MKHTKEIDGNAVIRKRAVEIINEATANGLEREEIREHLCNAWKRVFNEEYLGLDTNTEEEGLGLDTNTEEEDPDLTGGFVNGVAGSADALQEDSEENLRTQIDEATTKQMASIQEADTQRIHRQQYWLEMQQKRKAVELLLSRKAKKRQQEERKQEQKTFDEFAIQQFYKKRTR